MSEFRKYKETYSYPEIILHTSGTYWYIKCTDKFNDLQTSNTSEYPITLNNSMTLKRLSSSTEMEMIENENKMIDITEIIKNENRRYQIATKRYNTNSSNYIKTTSSEYINNSNYKRITESTINIVTNDTDSVNILVNDSNIIYSNENSKVKVTLNTFHSLYNVSPNEIVESNEKQNWAFGLYEEKPQNKKIVDTSTGFSPITSKELIENEIGSQRNILHDKICDNLPNVLQNLKSSKDNVKKSRDKKCKENYNIIPIRKEKISVSLIDVKENVKSNINNFKKLKNKILAKDEILNNRDLNENNNAESKNWYNN